MSYLTNRKIHTVVNETESYSLPIKYGVPQGSVLGPILFTLYINDIKHLSNKYEIKLFADDTSLFCVSDNYVELESMANQALKDCHNWLRCNRLTLNIAKTHYLIFKKTNRDTPHFSLKLGDETIKEENETKYLGLIIQNNLNWNIHISKTINSINKLIPLFYQIRRFLTPNKRLLIYKSLVLSKINYAIELYGRKNSNWLKQLQTTQNRLLKIILFRERLFHTNQIHHDTKILKVEHQAELRLLLLIHRNIYYPQLQPELMTKTIKLNNSLTNRNLRNNLNIFLTTQSFNLKNKVIDSAGIIWNAIQTEIQNQQNRTNFKTKFIALKINSYIEPN